MRELIADRPKQLSSWQLFLQDKATSPNVGKLAMQVIVYDLLSALTGQFIMEDRYMVMTKTL